MDSKELYDSIVFRGLCFDGVVLLLSVELIIGFYFDDFWGCFLRKIGPVLVMLCVAGAATYGAMNSKPKHRGSSAPAPPPPETPFERVLRENRHALTEIEKAAQDVLERRQR